MKTTKKTTKTSSTRGFAKPKGVRAKTPRPTVRKPVKSPAAKPAAPVVAPVTSTPPAAPVSDPNQLELPLFDQPKPLPPVPTVSEVSKASNNFEGATRIDNLPIEDQMKQLFNPLHNLTNTVVKDAPSQSTYIVQSKK